MVDLDLFRPHMAKEPFLYVAHLLPLFTSTFSTGKVKHLFPNAACISDDITRTTLGFTS